MSLIAEQLAQGVRQWPKRHANHPGALAYLPPGGPYHVMVVLNGNLPPYGVRVVLKMFGGVEVPYLCPRTGKVLAGQMSVHVLPAQVYEQVLASPSSALFHRCADLEPTPFTAPPTEADLSAVFVAAMSPWPNPTQPPGAAPYWRAACDALGWRTVAALVGAMDEDTLGSIVAVRAVLSALASAPAALTAWPRSGARGAVRGC